MRCSDRTYRLSTLAVQERFHQLVPALSKYSSVTVACTLIVIGGLGLREVWQESHPAQMPAVVGALLEMSADAAAGACCDAARLESSRLAA